ncbi:MAG TPA: alanine--glyoxylate aminotransferase family protein [Candidatus Dormibacteraeota bacterium]|nr:alanine--glyoxylate aminotransferase family protein [Candidatus Dormibacteraeota bacterium]
MRDSETLLIPGPVSVGAEVLAALSRPVSAHYGDDWVVMYRRLTSSLARIFGTEGDVLPLFGPGTAALEACLASTLAQGDKVLVATNGLFGRRIAEVARRLNLEVHTITTEGYDPVRPQHLAQAMRDHPGVRAFAVVHHETSLGLLNPVQELCTMARRYGLLTIVDAVASLGGVPLEMDAWGIDLCVGVANKCLGAPVGVAPVAVGERAWAAVDDSRQKQAGWYLNLATWRRFDREWGAWHPSPTTMPTNSVVALAVAVEGVMARGLDAHHARFAQAAARVRDGLRELDFEMVIPEEHASPMTTAVWGRKGMDVPDYLEWMRSERHLRLGSALGDLAGRAFRVGHMGRAADPDVQDAYLRGTADYVALKL